jgi:TRAP-type C4-dicarboxylate transport system substrate-binding protein
MNRKVVSLLTIIVCGVLALGIMPPSVLSAEPIVLKAGGAWPKATASVKVYFDFFDIVNELSNGQLQIEWVGGPEFVKVRDLPTSAAVGTIDVFQCSDGYLAGSVPEGAIADAYPMYRSYENAVEGYYNVLEIVSPIFEQKLKIKPIGQTLFFPFFLWTKQPVRKMEDIEGLKIRGHGGLVPFIISELGGSPVTTPTEEVYMALERGIIDGAVRNLPAFNSFKEYEFAKYGVSIPVTWATADIFISLKSWNKLPKDLQNVLWEAGKKITELNAKHWKKMDQVFMKKFPEQGVTFFDPPESMEKVWREKVIKGANKGANDLSPKYAEKIINAFKEAAQ